MRARLALSETGLPTVTPFDRQDSSMMGLFADADCLLMREIDAPAAKAGDMVKIVDLRTANHRF